MHRTLSFEALSILIEVCGSALGENPNKINLNLPTDFEN
jgi:hypothetical protein